MPRDSPYCGIGSGLSGMGTAKPSRFAKAAFLTAPDRHFPDAQSRRLPVDELDSRVEVLMYTLPALHGRLAAHDATRRRVRPTSVSTRVMVALAIGELIPLGSQEHLKRTMLRDYGAILKGVQHENRVIG
jgi:hypothetical protein